MSKKKRERERERERELWVHTELDEKINLKVF